jgi:hypothetical protein
MPVCSVFGVPTFGFMPIDPYTNSTAYYDAGPALTLAGPDGKKVIALSTSRSYSKSVDPPTPAASIAELAPPFFNRGAWNLSAPGGADLPTFQQALALQSPFRWTNRDTLSVIDRQKELLITWDNTAPVSTGTVTVRIENDPPSGVPLPQGLSAGVNCRASYRDGRITVPSEWLQKLASTFPGEGSSLAVSSDLSRAAVFTLPLKNGDTVPMSVETNSSEAIGVGIQ